MTRYPDLIVHRIGGSGIVIIAHPDFPGDIIQKDDLIRLYDNKSENTGGYPGIAEVRATVQRSDASGTEETIAQWLFGPTVKNLDSAGNAGDTSRSGKVEVLSADGSMAVLNLVKATPGSIGFVDFGFAEANPEVKMLRIGTGSGDVFPGTGVQFGPAIRDELSLQNGMDDRYVEGLTRPLLYLTKGSPDKWEEAFILFAQSPGAAKYYKEVGYFPIIEISR